MLLRGASSFRSRPPHAAAAIFSEKAERLLQEPGARFCYITSATIRNWVDCTAARHPSMYAIICPIFL